MIKKNIIREKRKLRDIKNLLTSEYKILERNDSKNTFVVLFTGPKDSIYENGFWKVFVSLPEEYPFKSPSIGFLNKIFHPNIDWR